MKWKYVYQGSKLQTTKTFQWNETRNNTKAPQELCRVQQQEKWYDKTTTDPILLDWTKMATVSKTVIRDDCFGVCIRGCLWSRVEPLFTLSRSPLSHHPSVYLYMCN